MAKLNNKPSAPGAWVVNSKDRGRKSIKNGKVYLRDKEEFKIELYNPLQYSVLADIKLNGKSISENGLVIKPAERFYLECFIDDKKKFVFNTYEVENTNENLDAISKNGLLEVFFYKESITSINNWYNKIWYYPNYIYPTWQQPYYYLNGSSNNTITLDNSTCTTLCSTTLGSATLGSITTSNDTSYTCNGATINNIETGRVEGGYKSNQKFGTDNTIFEQYYIASVVVQLLPESRKPIESKDIKYVAKDSLTVIDLISKLGDLHKSGILTDAEFNSKKSELLSKI